MDTAFQTLFSDYNLQQRLEILGYGSRDAYLEAKPTIDAKAQDMVAHYLGHGVPNGYKAQVVTTSREACGAIQDCPGCRAGKGCRRLEQANR